MDVVHFVELSYRLGEEEERTGRTFTPALKKLEIITDLPDRVYPGQEIETTIQVKDIQGKPVPKADLTAMAYNQLLNYNPSDLPYYGPPVIGRHAKASYELGEQLTATSTIPLSYDYWNAYARLDTLDYYRFAYPRENIFIHTEDTPDGITQFTPYVMHNGEALEIYAIECDGIPLFFSWTYHQQGYSFPVENATPHSFHTLTLRLHDRVLTLEGIHFEPGKKTLISMERDYLPEQVKQIQMPNQSGNKNHERYYLTDKEILKYKDFISEIRVHSGVNVSWLQQKDKIYPVYYRQNNEENRTVLYGPFPPGRTSYRGGVEYTHTGGFRYEYEPTVVYKYSLQTTTPGELKFSKQDNLLHVHEFHITADSIQRFLAGKEESNLWYWQPEEFTLWRPGLKLHLDLSHTKIKSRIGGVAFYDKNSDITTVHPKEMLQNNSRNTSLPAGMYDIYLFYMNGEYRKIEDIPVQENCYIRLNMINKEIHPANDISGEWLSQITEVWINYQKDNPTEETSTLEKYYQPVNLHAGTNARTIEGIATDAEGDPFTGCFLLVAGTNFGTITDTNGKFILNLEGLPVKDMYRLNISFIGFNTLEINAAAGNYVQATMDTEAMLLDEVIVIGYGTQKRLDYAAAIGITQSSDSYQVPASAPAWQLTDREAENRLYQELLTLSGLRRNFSDVGFWQPVLYTDKQGEASFRVTIPDNITQWNTVVYAMNQKLQTGTLRHAIQSYKPLMGELKTPRFVVTGDSAWAAATIRNYTEDKQINGYYQYAINGDTIRQETISPEVFWQQRMPMHPVTTDSMTTTFLFTRNDGYKDGEERTIPVIPTGIKIADGDLRILKNGEQVHLSTKPGEETHVRITGNVLNIYEEVAHYLMDYEYACNEQLASKLTGLLCYKMYTEQSQGKRFRYDKQVHEIISRLLRNQNKEQLWSWWGRTDDSSLWMSAHILKALKMATDAGYKVNISLKWAKNDYMETLSYRQPGINDIELLHTLSQWGLPQDYEKAVEYFEDAIRKLEEAGEKEKRTYKKSYLKDKMLLWEIRLQQGLPFDTEILKPYLHKTNTGQYYCDDNQKDNWRSDKLAKTLIAYRLIRNDSVLSSMKEGMQMYILSTRTNYWNTYQSANILSTLLPDLIADNSTAETPVCLTLSGKKNREVTEMEYQSILRNGEELIIEKKEGAPVIYSSWQYKRKTEGYSTDAFSITTHFQGNNTELKAGTPVQLIVQVDVKEENSEYIMIEVPIPAGCSYASKNQYYHNEVHREYFKEKTIIFCRELSKGTYTFSIDLLPRFTGTYHINPVKVELMYLPAINAMNDIKKIKIADME
ncbi:MAG: carboxypeptidase-like regulatory domain-containing protein [Tannerellaceae bacterium]|nr:carboxypeptidase-like regulatory domain-containing protein [Tannerellaceae bacterium]